MAKKKMSQFIVIGMGRFGTAVTKQLYHDGAEVLAVDVNEELLRAVEDHATHTATADYSDEAVLKELGIENFDAAIICIGTDVESNIFISLMCKQMGVPYVISKAMNEKHRQVLEKIGVDLVIFPEELMGIRLADMLTQPNMLEVMELSENYRIIEIKTPSAWRDKSLRQLDLRNKFGATLLLIKRGSEIINYVTADTVLAAGDTMILGGSVTHINRIKSKLTEKVGDIEDLL